MAIKLSANYSKKLGLPNYSSHSFSASVEVELTEISQVEVEIQKLYALLQHSVDQNIQDTGFVPQANGNNGHLCQSHNGNGANGNPKPKQNWETWNCSPGQKGFIQRLVNEHNLDKQEVENLALQLFSLGVKALNKLQASQLIEELLAKVGQSGGSAMDSEPTSTVMTTPPITKGRSENQVITDLQGTVSASRLSLFLQCRLKFFFRYIAQIQKPKTPALHVGSTVHSVLKTWNKARWLKTPLSLKDLHDEYSKAWTDNTEGQVQWQPGEEEAEKTVGWRLIDTYLREFSPDSKPEAVEVPVDVDLKSHGLPKLIGILDLIQGGKIIDYKTSSSSPHPEKVAHTAEVQTSSYAILYRHNTDRKEGGIELHHLVKLKNPKVVITELPPMSEGQQTRLFHLMHSYIQGLERRDFIPSPSIACFSCDYFNECRRWK